jgi:hypothetical protein
MLRSWLEEVVSIDNTLFISSVSIVLLLKSFSVEFLALEIKITLKYIKI